MDAAGFVKGDDESDGDPLQWHWARNVSVQIQIQSFNCNPSFPNTPQHGFVFFAIASSVFQMEGPLQNSRKVMSVKIRFKLLLSTIKYFTSSAEDGPLQNLPKLIRGQSFIVCYLAPSFHPQHHCVLHQ